MARRSYPAGAVAAGLVLLIAVTAAASRTRLFHEKQPPLPVAVSRLAVDATVYLFLAALLATAALVALALLDRGGYVGPLPRRRPLWEVMTQWVLGMLAAAFLAWLLVRLRRVPGGTGQPMLGGPGAVTPGPGAASTLPATPPALDLAAAGLIGLAIAAAVLAGGRRLAARRRSAAARTALARELATAIGESLDDLRSEADPRRAVIWTYARMERVLQLDGLERRPAEAPLEFVSRALAALTLPERSIRRLADLYEFARFSPHDVDGAMRDEAVGCLAEIRAGLVEQGIRGDS